MAKKNTTLIRGKLSKAKNHIKQGNYTEAITILEKIIATKKSNDETFYLLGIIYKKSYRPDEAIESFKQAVKINPGYTAALILLGTLQIDNDSAEAGITNLTRALKQEQSNGKLLDTLIKTQLKLGYVKQAIDSYNIYLSKQPNEASVLASVAYCYFMRGELSTAKKHYLKALKIQKHPGYLDGLGSVHCQQGNVEAALKAFKEVIQVDPLNKKYHSSLLLAQNYNTDTCPEMVLINHKKWAEKFEQKSSSIKYTGSTDKKLNIGYISPDFREHSVAYFVKHLIKQHDRNNFNVYCYSNSLNSDATTEEIKNSSDHWKNIAKFNDSDIFKIIRNDKIDILVDLSGHTAGNRLGVFAMKPAPIQVSYIGYPSTTGLQNIDYHITDCITDSDESNKYYSEELIRIDGCFLCYTPPSNTPDISVTPAVENNYITFGSFNNLAKINREIVELWSKVLHNVPQSKLIIKNPSLTDKETASYYYNLFDKQGISKDSISLIGHTETVYDHLVKYNLIDIALDTFPYNGTTTTCEALYMGVPVITLQGDAHISRVSSSLLLNSDLSDLIANSKDDYVSIAKNLTNDIDSLNSLRSGLRDKFSNSIVCDAARHTNHIENIYKDIWEKWRVNNSTSARR